MALGDDVATLNVPLTRMAGKSGEPAGLGARDWPHRLDEGAMPALGD